MDHAPVSPRCRPGSNWRLDGDRVELLAGVLGDDKPDPRGHGDHEDRYRQESEGEGPRSLLQCHGSERPQHKSYEEADDPHDAVGHAANAGREDFGGERRARAPKTEKPETPAEPEYPEPEVARCVDPEGHKDRAPDQERDKTDASADLVGEPAGRAQPEKADEAPEHIEGAVFRR